MLLPTALHYIPKHSSLYHINTSAVPLQCTQYLNRTWKQVEQLQSN